MRLSATTARSLTRFELIRLRENFPVPPEHIKESHDRADTLIQAHVALAACFVEASVKRVNDTLDTIADAVRPRVRGVQLQAKLAHLHEVLFEEHRFIGSDDHHALANCCLPSVLLTKRGLPVTLALVYKAVAERIGLYSWGIGMPAHFLAGVQCGEMMMVDVYNRGRIVNREEAKTLMMAHCNVEWSDDFLTPVTNTLWLTRTTQTVLHLSGANRKYNDVATALELEMLLYPDVPQLQRDLAIVLARVGMSRPAARMLAIYLEDSGLDDEHRADLVQLLEVLKQ